jgi:chorismate mutase
MSADRLWAVRGAVQVERNVREAILGATTQLVEALVAQNGLAPESIVSVIFTCTDDLDAEFPAVAARELGLTKVPLLNTREISVPGAMPRVVRVLVHYYAPPDHQPTHVYLGEAQALRADLNSAQ